MATPRKKVDGRRKVLPHGGGRTPSLTPAVQEAIFANRRLGISWERSARLAGVEVTSVKNWKARAVSALEKTPTKRNAFDNKCISFLTESKIVEDEWVRRCETVLAFALESGSGKERWNNASDADRALATSTAKFKLTHQASDEYSTKSATEVSGPNGGSIDISLSGEDVFKVLLEAKAVEEASEE